MRRSYWFILAVVVGALLLVVSRLINQLPNNDAAAIDSTPSPTPVYTYVQATERDYIPAIDDPQFLAADVADDEYEPDELVIGLAINGDVRAYSVPVLSRHEIVNDVVGGQPVAVTWCPLCFTGIVYTRDVEGSVLNFVVSGLLVHNNLVMVDRETDSLWSQVLGEAIEGPLLGTRLEFIESWFTTWGEWKARHPDTRALAKNGITIDNYASYYNSTAAGLTNGLDLDERLPLKVSVIGVSHEEQAVAYPFSLLRRERVINDQVGDLSVVVIFVAEGETGLVFDRTVAQQMLTFRYIDEQLVDEQTGSVWDAWQGIAVSGPLEGQLLLRVPSTRSFWFGWRDWYPGTRIYER